MKKIGMVVLLVAIAMVAPKLVGNFTQDIYKQSIDNYPWDKAKIRVEHREYNESWFSSRAVTAFEMDLGLPQRKKLTWVTTSHIQHGPVLFTDDGVKFGFAYIQTKSTFEGLPQKAQGFLDTHLDSDGIQITSLVDFNQHLHDGLNIKRFTVEKDNVQASFGGLIVKGASTLDYSTMKGDVKFLASQIIGEKGSVHIADASGSYDLQNYRNLMMLGDINVLFPLLEVKGVQGSITLEGLSLDEHSWEKDGKLSETGSFKVEAIKGSLPLTALQYDVEIKDVNIEAIQAWTDAFGLKQDQESAALSQAQTNQLVDAILQEGLAVKQRLKVDGMDGTLMVDWDIKFVGFPNKKSFVEVENKADYLEALDMHLFIEIDDAVVMATPFASMISPYVEQGFVSKQDDKFIVDITLMKGVATVNGQDIPRGKVLQLLGLAQP